LGCWRSLALFACAAAPAALAEKRIALQISSKDDKPGVGALVNPLDGVRVVGDALRAVGFELMKARRKRLAGDHAPGHP